MAKYDKKLDECWNLHGLSFEKVSSAVAELIDTLVGCANARGVPYDVARDTYIDWIRSKMEQAEFM